MLKLVSRKLLDIWVKTGIAPGWHYENMERFGSYLANSHPLPAFLPNNCCISCNLQDHVQRQIYFLGVYEPIEAYLFTRLLHPGMTVIDAGANVGQYTLLASTRVGVSGSVHSFEPVPSTFVQLKKNVDTNKLSNVHINQIALWKEATTLKLSLSDEMTNNVGSYSVGVINSAKTIESVSIRLDDYAFSNDIDKIDVIKMDIEGAETPALLGMQNIIERDHPILLMEINRLASQGVGYNPENLWLLLTKEFGYKGYLIGMNSCREVMDISKIQQNNFIFIHKSQSCNLINETWKFKDVLRWGRSGKK